MRKHPSDLPIPLKFGSDAAASVPFGKGSRSHPLPCLKNTVSIETGLFGRVVAFILKDGGERFVIESGNPSLKSYVGLLFVGQIGETIRVITEEPTAEVLIEAMAGEGFSLDGNATVTAVREVSGGSSFKISSGATVVAAQYRRLGEMDGYTIGTFDETVLSSLDMTSIE